MFKKTCRCGKSTKNFKIDIGPFYIAECCEEAGYDYKGVLINKKEEIKEVKEEKEEVKEVEKSEEKEVDLEKMSQKELQALCDEKNIEYAKNESKAKLRAKLK